MELNSEKHSVASIIGNLTNFIDDVLTTHVSNLSFYLWHSTTEPKGSDCFDSFKAMQDCMSNYPTLYGNDEKPGEEEEEEATKNESDESAPKDSSSEVKSKT